MYIALFSSEKDQTGTGIFLVLIEIDEFENDYKLNLFKDNV